MATEEVKRVKATWNDLGSSDPLWAILSDKTKRNNRWDEDAFFKTGERDVTRYMALIRQYAGLIPPYCRVLDFGCGVGRLTRWWGARAEKAYGVDISQTMIEGAQAHNMAPERVEFRVNEESDLRQFDDNFFDVVASHICLQHMPWAMAESYIREFARVCRSGGVIIFQLPTRWLRYDWLARVRQFVVENLPFGLGRRYRQWRHGTATTFEFYCTPLETVEQLIVDMGGVLLHKDPDNSATSRVESFIFVVKKP